MTDKNAKFYARRSGAVGGPVRHEVFKASAVGVELEGRAYVELSVRHGEVELRSDDVFSMAPASSNVVSIHPNSSFTRYSVIETSDHDTDQMVARAAVDGLRRLLLSLGHAGSVRHKADRNNFQDEGLLFLGLIERAL